ncbi:SDR family oxidoreductase [Parasphingorhabdus halotolerans]|uniref:SDR family oxidoreductase n=1 Tax=Parasphingorhabdus halotolerans TaxID=2725558 RepID=A0A6H2DLK3_9SPHN|nr:SDR family oxidoreductase [Parasphingorhabdus halotolerans]QJB68536.1 SDR family oxidoreductase [Parasphingorhabdus halotolerans]
MSDSLFSMHDKVCVITGGSRGLGKAMARAFLNAEASKVYITARKPEECAQTADELSNLNENGECIALPSDMSSGEDIGRFAKELADREGHIDVLVNNAGTGWLASVEEFPEIGWDKVMDLNVKTPFFLTQQLLPLLKANATPENSASVINIGSVAGFMGSAGSGVSYGTSKAAIHQLTRNLASLLAEDNIRVNAIAPGRFHSKMTSYVEQDKAQYDKEIKMIPLHRWGQDEDIMGPALLLASRAGAYMTGEIITVDGGSLLIW